jgi:Holliday junction resolvasome RuvABC endonuclease subunit
MTSVKEVHKLVLAIDPAPRGFGYALFEGPQKPLDWGITEIRFQKNKRSFKHIKKLITYYHPDLVILEEPAGKGSRRCRRVEKLIDQVSLFAKLQKIPVQKYSRDRVREVFSMFGVRTKHEIAIKISEWLPVLSSRMPPKRKPWMSEDRRMNIFDAVALVLTYYYLEE